MHCSSCNNAIFCRENLHIGIYTDVTLTHCTNLHIFAALPEQDTAKAAEEGLKEHNKDSEAFTQPPKSPNTNLKASDGICGK